MSGMTATEERAVVIDGGQGTARVRIERSKGYGETLFFFGAFGVLYIFTRGKEGAASERSFIIEILYNKSSAGE